MYCIIPCILLPLWMVVLIISFLNSLNCLIQYSLHVSFLSFCRWWWHSWYWSIWWLPHNWLAERHCQGPHAPQIHCKEKAGLNMGLNKSNNTIVTFFIIYTAFNAFVYDKVEWVLLTCSLISRELMMHGLGGYVSFWWEYVQVWWPESLTLVPLGWQIWNLESALKHSGSIENNVAGLTMRPHLTMEIAHR